MFWYWAINKQLKTFLFKQPIMESHLIVYVMVDAVKNANSFPQLNLYTYGTAAQFISKEGSATMSA